MKEHVADTMDVEFYKTPKGDVCLNWIMHPYIDLNGINRGGNVHVCLKKADAKKWAKFFRRSNQNIGGGKIMKWIDRFRMTLKDEILFVLHPGLVISKTDGQEHYISAIKLANCWQVKMKNCIVYDYGRAMGIDREGSLIHLYTMSNGKYNLEKRIKDFIKIKSLEGK